MQKFHDIKTGGIINPIDPKQYRLKQNARYRPSDPNTGKPDESSGLFLVPFKEVGQCVVDIDHPPDGIGLYLRFAEAEGDKPQKGWLYMNKLHGCCPNQLCGFIV